MSARFMIVVVTGLLVWGAYWAALPWLDCWRPWYGLVGPRMVSYCTFGVGGTDALKDGLYPNVLVAGLYVAAAGWSGVAAPYGRVWRSSRARRAATSAATADPRASSASASDSWTAMR